MHNQFAQITKKASKTFYTASLFFPKAVRNDVFILYSFVRIADDFVDSTPPQIDSYNNYKKETFLVFDNKKSTDNEIIAAFIEVAKRKHISRSLIEDYFTGQEIALTKKTFNNFLELQAFMYGVAEVIGLMMCYVLDIPKKAHPSALLLGRAMQLVNIIRDISEDEKNGYIYLPQDELQRFGLPSRLTEDIITEHPEEFNSFMSFQTERILELLRLSKKGFLAIPKKYRLPIVVCADLYANTTKKIAKNPQIIFKRKVKPTQKTIVSTIIRHSIF